MNQQIAITTQATYNEDGIYKHLSFPCHFSKQFLFNMCTMGYNSPMEGGSFLFFGDDKTLYSQLKTHSGQHRDLTHDLGVISTTL